MIFKLKFLQFCTKPALEGLEGGVMHEHSLARDLAYLIFKQIKEKKFKNVKKIIFAFGEASGIEKDLLEHSFKDHIFPGTLCENAELEFIIEKPKLKCRKCSKEYEDVTIKCACGSVDFDISSGKDIRIVEIIGE